MLVSGAPGAGKSALIEEVRRAWAEAGGVSYATVGLPQPIPAPYQIWYPIWRALLGLRTYDDPFRDGARLAANLQTRLPHLSRTAAIFQNLLGVQQQEAASLEMLEAPTRQKLILDATVGLLEYAAQRAPVLLTFESLQTVDSASRAL
ncbi:MAG: AAA family ATPase, partial [Anaerolineae bacterium]|nr:AAA family ATPase [Anaerolineae bacterium]